jgi:hypothetical protein
MVQMPNCTLSGYATVAQFQHASIDVPSCLLYSGLAELESGTIIISFQMSLFFAQMSFYNHFKSKVESINHTKVLTLSM